MNQISAIAGLVWNDNYCAETGPDSYTLVANPGPLVTDFHLWLRDSYEAFILHVGQEDRFTFIGDPDRSITARFVDCRRDSPSAHVEHSMTFQPDAREVLHIPQGVAMYFDGLMNVTVRSEPIWFAPSRETPYAPGNDQIRIDAHSAASEFPLIYVNDLPMPSEVLQLVCRRQQEMLSTGAPYDVTYGVVVGNEIHRLKADG